MVVSFPQKRLPGEWQMKLLDLFILALFPGQRVGAGDINHDLAISGISYKINPYSLPLRFHHAQVSGVQARRTLRACIPTPGRCRKSQHQRRKMQHLPNPIEIN
jgi:hypothetical protein